MYIKSNRMWSESAKICQNFSMKIYWQSGPNMPFTRLLTKSLKICMNIYVHIVAIDITIRLWYRTFYYI